MEKINKGKDNKGLIVGGLILLGLGIGFGLYFYFKNKNKPKPNENKPEPTPEKSPDKILKDAYDNLEFEFNKDVVLCLQEYKQRDLVAQNLLQIIIPNQVEIKIGE